MKYLFTIFALVCSATLATIYIVWPDKELPESSVAVTVNGHPLAKSTIAAQSKLHGYHNENYLSLLDSVITRELLIQEAQRLKIDKEESFRISLQSFYEQSLINSLMDRKYNDIEIKVAEQEVAHYASLFGKKITFSRLPVSNEPPYLPTSKEGTQSEVIFDDLAESLQVTLAGLAPGEFTVKFDTGTDRFALRLDTIEATTNTSITPPDNDYLRRTLEDYKRQQQISNWLNELRKSASIKIHNG